MRRSRDTIYCDDCGERINGSPVSVSCLPRNIDSANAGESAWLCLSCNESMLHEGVADLEREDGCDRTLADRRTEA